MGIFQWKEVYTTVSSQKKAEAAALLEKNKIPVKIKTAGSRNRIAADVIWGADPMTVNPAGLRQNAGEIYILYTKKEYWEQARWILGL